RETGKPDGVLMPAVVMIAADDPDEGIYDAATNQIEVSEVDRLNGRRDRRPDVAESHCESAEAKIDAICCLHAEDRAEAGFHSAPARARELRDTARRSGTDHWGRVAVAGRRREDAGITGVRQSMGRLVRS